ncbi:DUF1822 family protein [Phormidesmis priestleyi]
MSSLVEPTDWWLEISPEKQSESWQWSRNQSTPWGQWNAYLNHLCLQSCLTEFQTDYAPVTSWLTKKALSACLDAVNGTVITSDTTRFAIIPTEAVDFTELEVPQEWVDIPSWVADYYLAVQVAPNHDEIRIYGYVTHQQLKALGEYDVSDRTYCLDAQHLIPDLNTLWIAYPHYPISQTRIDITPIPSLSSTQAETLIQRLGNATETLLRLEVPFTMWGALLEDSIWRQRLYEQRQANSTVDLRILTTRLSEWLEGQFDTVWQMVEMVLAPQQAIASRSRVTQSLEGEVIRAKVLTFDRAGQNNQLALLVSISTVNESEVRIGVQIHPTGGATTLPNETQLRLLSSDGVEVGQARATVTETIQLQFRANLQEQFSLEVTCGGETIVETFEG